MFLRLEPSVNGVSFKNLLCRVDGTLKRGSYHRLFIYLFSLDVGVVNLTLGGFCSDKMEDMGLKSHHWMCWLEVCCSQLKSLLTFLLSQLRGLLLEWLPAAQSLYWSMTAHSPAHKSRFYLPCDGIFSKKSVFLERWVLSTCYPLKSGGGTSSKKPPNFSLRGPQHLLSSQKRKRNSPLS